MLLDRNGKLTMWNQSHHVCYIAFGRKLPICFNCECLIKVACQVIRLVSLFNIKLGGKVWKVDFYNEANTILTLDLMQGNFSRQKSSTKTFVKR